MIKQLLFAGATVAAALAVSASAQAGATYFSGYTTAVAPSGLTPVVGFTAPSGQKVSVTVTDCCIVGDYYATYVDGSYIGTTPYEPIGGSTLSSETFRTTLGLGTSHAFQLQDQYLGILPAGVGVTIAGVPEPSTWAMMLIGVFGLGAATRARRAGKLNTAGALA